MGTQLESEPSAMASTSQPATGLKSTPSVQSVPASSVSTVMATGAPNENDATPAGSIAVPAMADPEKSAADALPAAPAPVPGEGFPDGGAKAWLCVFGSFCCLFVSFGWINCIGVFQDYYQEHLLSQFSSSAVAWIPSLETFIMFACGPLWGYLYDQYGPRQVLLVGTFFHVFGLMMTSLSTQYYQFILAQGLCSPFGASALFFCAVSASSTWFFHRRALALGIVASGSSLGGVIFPILVQNLIPEVGFPWAMRTAAFLILALLVVANLTITSRIPPGRKGFNFKALYKPFAEPAFYHLSLGSFFGFLGLFIPLDFLILQGQTVGVPVYLAQYLIPILNGASVFGRTLPGWMGDKLGRFNILSSFTVLAGALCLALWLPAKGEAPIIVFAVLFGFASGVFVSIIPACIAQISPIQEIGTRNGALFATTALAALVGNPIAGAIAGSDGGNYAHVQIFAGVMLIGGGVFVWFARMVQAGLRPAKV